MKRGHEQTEPTTISNRDHANGHWYCPVCGEPYDTQQLAQECLDRHNDQKENER